MKKKEFCIKKIKDDSNVPWEWSTLSILKDQVLSLFWRENCYFVLCSRKIVILAWLKEKLMCRKSIHIFLTGFHLRNKLVMHISQTFLADFLEKQGTKLFAACSLMRSTTVNRGSYYTLPWVISAVSWVYSVKPKLTSYHDNYWEERHVKIHTHVNIIWNA